MISDRLREGTVTRDELIDALQKMPPETTIRLSRGILMVKYDNLLRSIDQAIQGDDVYSTKN